MELCPICNNNANINRNFDRNVSLINCLRCGRFEISDEALRLFEYSDIASKSVSVSYWIKQNQKDNEYIKLYSSTLREILVPFEALKPKEQIDKLLLYLSSKLKSHSAKIKIMSEELIPAIGAMNGDDVKNICIYLSEQKLINLSDIEEYQKGQYVFELMITILGWEKYEILQGKNKESKIAFMAMKFGEEPLATIYKEIMKPAVEKTGFILREIRENQKAGLIDEKLMSEIKNSKFLIADLTHNNNGAYWEAGIAHGMGKPVIYVCEKDKFDKDKSHFDTNHHLTVLWKNDDDGLKKFADELKATIRATFPNDAIMED